jgi:hypothetical protein
MIVIDFQNHLKRVLRILVEEHSLRQKLKGYDAHMQESDTG